VIVVEDLSVEVPDTNAHHWYLTQHSEESDSSVLICGFNGSTNVDIQRSYDHFERKIYFNNWAPCEFAQYKVIRNKNAFEYEEYFDEIYSICPYSVDWMNSQNFSRRYKPIFYPFSPYIIPATQQKEYDVIYHGGIHGNEHVECLTVIKEFNYRYVTMTTHINADTYRCLPIATNVDLSFQEKINLVAKSKISVCYNMVHLKPEHIPAIKSYNRWKDNRAFEEVDGHNIMPQFKTRAHEAAIARTLNLVQKDSWNIIEDYYEPDTEFIYFTDSNDLRAKIQDVLANWDRYESVVEKAYHKAMR